MSTTENHLEQEESVNQKAEPPVWEEIVSDSLYGLTWSHMGSAHLGWKLPNQDSANLLSDNGLILASVADGLGSCKFSDVGSKLTVTKVTERMREFLVENGSNTQETIEDRQIARLGSYRLSKVKKKSKKIRTPLSRLDFDHFKDEFINTINDVRQELDDIAASTPIELPEKTNLSVSSQTIDTKALYTKADFATTCLFAVTDGSHAFCAHVGDGGIYLICESEAKLLIEPTKGSTVTETAPITVDNWLEYLEVRTVSLPDDAIFLCLMSDGFAESIDRTEPSRFFNRLLTEARKTTRSAFREWLKELNDFFEEKGFSNDDKTVALIFLKDVFAERV